MSSSHKSERVCSNGHTFRRSSACPVCPLCEKTKSKGAAFAMLVAPARRALENAGITDLEQLARFREDEILDLHGMGPSSLPKLRNALKMEGLRFKAR